MMKISGKKIERGAFFRTFFACVVLFFSGIACGRKAPSGDPEDYVPENAELVIRIQPGNAADWPFVECLRKLPEEDAVWKNLIEALKESGLDESDLPEKILLYYAPEDDTLGILLKGENRAEKYSGALVFAVQSGKFPFFSRLSIKDNPMPDGNRETLLVFRKTGDVLGVIRTESPDLFRFVGIGVDTESFHPGPGVRSSVRTFRRGAPFELFAEKRALFGLGNPPEEIRILAAKNENEHVLTLRARWRTRERSLAAADALEKLFPEGRKKSILRKSVDGNVLVCDCLLNRETAERIAGLFRKKMVRKTGGELHALSGAFRKYCPGNGDFHPSGIGADALRIPAVRKYLPWKNFSEESVRWAYVGGGVPSKGLREPGKIPVAFEKPGNSEGKEISPRKMQVLFADGRVGEIESSAQTCRELARELRGKSVPRTDVSVWIRVETNARKLDRRLRLMKAASTEKPR